MSLGEAVLDSLKDCEYKKIALCKHPPIPYDPNKDYVKDTVSAFKDNHLKMRWHSGTHEAFLIYVGSALEAIKSKGYFKTYVEFNKVYVEQCGRIKVGGPVQEFPPLNFFPGGNHFLRSLSKSK